MLTPPVHCRGEIVAVILQYLRDANLTQAASALESEVAAARISLPRSERCAAPATATHALRVDLFGSFSPLGSLLRSTPPHLLNSLLQLAMAQAHDLPSTPDEHAAVSAGLPKPLPARCKPPLVHVPVLSPACATVLWDERS